MERNSAARWQILLHPRPLLLGGLLRGREVRARQRLQGARRAHRLAQPEAQAEVQRGLGQEGQGGLSAARRAVLRRRAVAHVVRPRPLGVGPRLRARRRRERRAAAAQDRAAGAARAQPRHPPAERRGARGLQGQQGGPYAADRRRLAARLRAGGRGAEGAERRRRGGPAGGGRGPAASGGGPSKAVGGGAGAGAAAADRRGAGAPLCGSNPQTSQASAWRSAAHALGRCPGAASRRSRSPTSS